MDVGRITQLTNTKGVSIEQLVELFNVKKGENMFNLSGYKPEAPAESNFEPFKYEGPVSFGYARVEKTEKPSEFYGTPAGSDVFSIEMVVLNGDFAKRKIWKTWNLDTTVEDKKGKTPAQKLADQLFTCGLEFSDLEGLRTCAVELVSKNVNIKAYPIKFKDKKDEAVQMWNLKGFAENGATPAPSTTTSGSVAF